MKDYIKVLHDDLTNEIKDNITEISMLEQQNEIYDAFKKKLESILKQSDDVIDKIKKFINELGHNIQADKDNGETLTSGVSCSYVIDRLKDIIK